MNPKNNWENRLQSWKPRQPSAGLKARIFSKRTLSAEASLAALAEAFTLRWLAPSMACLLMALLTFTQHASGFQELGAGRGTVIFATLGGSNWHYSAKLPLRFEMEETALSSPTFDWTNATRILSSVTSFTAAATNKLK